MSSLAWDRIDAVPVIHGRLAFAREVRRRLLEDRYSAVAVELPPSLRRGVEQALDDLPRASAVVYSHEPRFLDREAPQYYVPIQPADGIVEALRMARVERVPVAYVDAEVEDYHGLATVLPDPNVIDGLGLEPYVAACAPFLELHPRRELDTLREQTMARGLQGLLGEVEGRVLFVCGLAHWSAIRALLARGEPIPAPDLEESPAVEVRVAPVDDRSLPLVMGELPYMVGRYELHRGGIHLEDFDPVGALKHLLLAARDLLIEGDPDTLEKPDTQRLGIVLDYVRKLSVRSGSLIPTPYQLAVAAKGCVGNDYTLFLLTAGNAYPFGWRSPEGRQPESLWDELASQISSAEFSECLWCRPGDDPTDLAMRDDAAAESDQPTLRLGEGRGVLDGEELTLHSRLPGTAFTLGRLSLERRPDVRQQEEFKTQWDESMQCSWPAEDIVIENFRDYVGKRALSLARVGQSRTEPFTTSFLDGLDIRATLRDVVERRIHVKEEPNLPGAVGALVIIFEEDDFGERYPWRTTWMAEHEEESTLCFYATDWRENIIGPGIARAHYGGCLLIFPPRGIPDMWEDLRFEAARTPSERLLLAGIYWSPDHYVVHVGKRPPRPEVHREATQRKKHVLHLPLSTFSSTTLERLRRVHVLNGRQVRTYAHRFIR